MKSLKTLLRRANLSELSRATGINIRTLRRIKSGNTTAPHPRTVDAIRSAVEAA